LVRIFPRREELAPAFRHNLSFDQLAMAWRVELQADLAALLPVGRILVLRLLLADLLVGRSLARQRRSRTRHRGGHDECPPRYPFIAPHADQPPAGAYF